jgi:hypothetical protein
MAWRERERYLFQLKVKAKRVVCILRGYVKTKENESESVLCVKRKLGFFFLS